MCFLLLMGILTRYTHAEDETLEGSTEEVKKTQGSDNRRGYRERTEQQNPKVQILAERHLRNWEFMNDIKPM